MTINRLLMTLCFGALLAPLSTLAAVSNISVSGASGYDATTTPTTPVIFGGNTGAIGGCASNPTTLCDSCTALTTVCDTGNADLVSHCAERSIGPNVILSITFTTDQAPAAGASVVVRLNDSTTNITLANSPTAAANTPITVQVRWGDICSAIANAGGGLDANCTSTSSADYSGNLVVGFTDGTTAVASAASQTFGLKISYIPYHTASPTLTSKAASAFAGGATPFLPGCASYAQAPFCDFAVGSGDAKVYINNLKSNSNGDGTIKWNSARLYFVPYAAGTVAAGASHGFCDINLASASATYADLPVSDKAADPTTDSYKVSTSKIKGLVNEQPYIFLLATQDETSIVTGFMDSGEFAAKAACAAGAVDGTCPYIGYPGKVIGLLDDQKCFIATAAFGSPMEPQVKLLRQFRNQFLLTNSIGTWFVHTYYRLSPPFANWIARHDDVRAVVRTLLWPLVWMADKVVDHSKAPAAMPSSESQPESVSAKKAAQ